MSETTTKPETAGVVNALQRLLRNPQVYLYGVSNRSAIRWSDDDANLHHYTFDRLQELQYLQSASVAGPSEKGQTKYTLSDVGRARATTLSESAAAQ